jgi:hypothetical protein
MRKCLLELPFRLVCRRNAIAGIYDKMSTFSQCDFADDPSYVLF